jgi:hypothetical protein
MRNKSFAVPVMGLSVMSLGLLSGCERQGGGGLIDPTALPPARPPVQVAVAPASVTLEVGERIQLVAVVANLPEGAPAGLRWESSDPDVASVDGSGVVACADEGEADVTARALAAESASARAAVTCTPAPKRKKPAPQPTPHPGPAPAPGALFALSTNQLSFQAQPFATSCPLRVGDLRVTNTSGQRASVRLSVGHDAIELTPALIDLQPGMWHDVIVKYNCSASASFTTQIVVTATAGGSSETRRVDVRGTIQ